MKHFPRNERDAPSTALSASSDWPSTGWQAAPAADRLRICRAVDSRPACSWGWHSAKPQTRKGMRCNRRQLYDAGLPLALAGKLWQEATASGNPMRRPVAAVAQW